MDKYAYIPNINKIKTETNQFLQYNKEKITKEKINEFFDFIKKIKNNNLGILLSKNYDEKKVLDFLKECDYDIELAKMKINYPIFSYLNNDYYNKINFENNEDLLKNDIYSTNKVINKEDIKFIIRENENKYIIKENENKLIKKERENKILIKERERLRKEKEKEREREREKEREKEREREREKERERELENRILKKEREKWILKKERENRILKKERDNKFLKKEKENNLKKEINNLLREKQKISNKQLTNILNELKLLKLSIPSNLKFEINKTKNLNNTLEKVINDKLNEDMVEKNINLCDDIKIEPVNLKNLYIKKEKIEKMKTYLDKYLEKELKEDNIIHIHNEIANYELKHIKYKKFKNKINKCKFLIENCNSLFKKINFSGFESNYIQKIKLYKNQSHKFNIKLNGINLLNKSLEEYFTNINIIKMIFEDYNNFDNTNELKKLKDYFEINKMNNNYYLELIRFKIKWNIDYNFIINNIENTEYHSLCKEKYNLNKIIFEKNLKIRKMIYKIENFNKYDYYINILKKNITIYDVFIDNKKIKDLINIKILEKDIINVNVNNEKINFIKEKYNLFKEIYDSYMKRKEENIIFELECFKKIISNGIINDHLMKEIFELKKNLNYNYQIYLYLKFYKKIDKFFDEENNTDNLYYKNIKLDHIYNIFKNKDKICKEYKEIFDNTLNIENNQINNLSNKVENTNNYSNNQEEFFINNLQYNVNRLLKIKNYNYLYNKLIKNENYQFLLNIKKKIKNKWNENNNNNNYDLTLIINLEDYDKFNLEKILNYNDTLEFKDNYYNIKEFKNFNTNLINFFELNKILEENFNSFIKKNKFVENEILILFYQYLKWNTFLIDSPLLYKIDTYFKEYINLLKISKYNIDKKTHKDMKNLIGNYLNNFKLYNRYFIKLKFKFNQYDIYLKEISKITMMFSNCNTKNKEYVLSIIDNFDFNKINIEYKSEDNIINIKNNKFDNNYDYENNKRQKKIKQNNPNKIYKKKNSKKKFMLLNKNEEFCCICRTNFNYQNTICCKNCEEWFHYDCIKIKKITNESRFECPICEYIKIIFNKKDEISNILYYLINRKISSENLEKIYKMNNIFKKEFKGEEIDYVENIKINNFNFIELSNEIINKTNDFLENFEELKKDTINYDFIKEYLNKAKNICYSYFNLPFFINFNEKLFKSFKILEILKKKFDLELNDLEYNNEIWKNSIENDLKLISSN